ncbi:MAG: hypothetical protein LBE76_05325, partial [Nitrososphaerota archaeon]|nr:hypothetical protein [Nitrososphaerota archaeon]
TQSKPEKAEEINNKYNYLVPETFLCWALFEYSYYNRRSEASESVAQFVMKTLENKTLDSAYVFNSTTGHHNEYSKFIELHYEAYKYLAGDKKNDIYEHLKELLTRCDRGT